MSWKPTRRFLFKWLKCQLLYLTVEKLIEKGFLSQTQSDTLTELWPCHTCRKTLLHLYICKHFIVYFTLFLILCFNIFFFCQFCVLVDIFRPCNTAHTPSIKFYLAFITAVVELCGESKKLKSFRPILYLHYNQSSPFWLLKWSC